jgi:hypothetical protein
LVPNLETIYCYTRIALSKLASSRIYLP